MENELPLLRLVIAGALGSMLGGLTMEAIRSGKGATGKTGWAVWVALVVSFALMTEHKILKGFFQTPTKGLDSVG